MGRSLAEEVSAAAIGTMRGRARVKLTVQTSVPGFEGLVGYAGLVDFDSDRCCLDVESHVTGETVPSVILDGSTTYTRASDAQWVFSSGAEGTRGMFHPSGLLDALVRAPTSATKVGERLVELELDHHVMDAAADAGLAPDWRSAAVAQISPNGRVLNIVLTHRSSEGPDSVIRVECALSEPVQTAQIDLPPAESTISMADKIEQDHNQADS
jgi:hypothetical protein